MNSKENCRGGFRCVRDHVGRVSTSMQYLDRLSLGLLAKMKGLPNRRTRHGVRCDALKHVRVLLLELPAGRARASQPFVFSELSVVSLLVKPACLRTYDVGKETLVYQGVGQRLSTS